MQYAINTLTKAFSVEYVVELCMFYVRLTIISLFGGLLFFFASTFTVRCVTDFSISSISKSVRKSGIHGS